MEWLLVFILGAAIGSFMNVLIVRTPRDESVSFPASHCMSCNTPLRPWHNIPILSWLFLRGKCSFCSATISRAIPDCRDSKRIDFSCYCYETRD